MNPLRRDFCFGFPLTVCNRFPYAVTNQTEILPAARISDSQLIHRPHDRLGVRLRLDDPHQPAAGVYFGGGRQPRIESSDASQSIRVRIASW